jgi:hypothetical protein
MEPEETFETLEVEVELEKALLQESSSTIRIGQCLEFIRQKRLFLPYPSLALYCKEKFYLEKSSVYNYIASWKVSLSLTISPIHRKHVSVSALAKIATYPERERQKVWDKFVRLEKPTISGLLSLYSTEVTLTGPNEYYTPPTLVLLAKQLNQGLPFDLDPCSSTIANRLHVGLLARQIFTVLDDGLSKDWHGSVFDLCEPSIRRHQHREEYARSMARLCYCTI